MCQSSCNNARRKTEGSLADIQGINATCGGDEQEKLVHWCGQALECITIYLWLQRKMMLGCRRVIVFREQKMYEDEDGNSRQGLVLHFSGVGCGATRQPLVRV